MEMVGPGMAADEEVLKARAEAVIRYLETMTHQQIDEWLKADIRRMIVEGVENDHPS